MLKVERSTMERANEWMHAIVVLDATGAEVTRLAPEERSDGVANTPAGLYQYWWSLILVPLEGSMTFPLTVHAIDKVAEHRCTWTVQNNGKIKRVKGVR